jgi:hypothetical protein
MENKLHGGNEVIVGTLLEDGETIAAGVGIVESSGRGTFQVAKLETQPDHRAPHEISDLYGNRWPIEDVSAEGDAPLDLHYNFTHQIGLPELYW